MKSRRRKHRPVRKFRKLRRNSKFALLWVSAINVGLFVFETSSGLIAGSVSLLANSFYLFADTFSYGILIFALHKDKNWNAGARLARGSAMLGLVVLLTTFILKRSFLGYVPESKLIGITAGLALIGNSSSMLILRKFGEGDQYLLSSLSNSRRNVFGGMFVLTASALVFALNSKWPDLIFGSLLLGCFARNTFKDLSKTGAKK